tara:strand:- start:1054 stop:1806 length:753 start_codon:yes stop_codon:yes gene_type:complete
MNFKIIVIFLILLTSCVNNTEKQRSEILSINNKFYNSGFTLIYDDNLYFEKIINKKMDDRDLIIFQKNLKKGTSVKLFNPINNKSLIAQVGRHSIYPNFNNSVVSKRIASELELSLEEPYIIIEEIIHNSAFIAKKTKMFEEEKKVANKAPVDKITVNDLNQSSKKKTNTNSQKFNYFIKIADFYFIDSAKIMRNRIINESTIKNVYIRELSKNKFRVILGPYLDLKSLQKEYNKLEKFNFENIEIIKNV